MYRIPGRFRGRPDILGRGIAQRLNLGGRAGGVIAQLGKVENEVAASRTPKCAAFDQVRRATRYVEAQLRLKASQRIIAARPFRPGTGAARISSQHRVVVTAKGVYV